MAYTLMSLRIIDFVILEIFDSHWQRNRLLPVFIHASRLVVLLLITTQISYCDQ